MTLQIAALIAMLSSAAGMYLSHKLDETLAFLINVAVFWAAAVLFFTGAT
jgi:hypothetical protein